MSPPHPNANESYRGCFGSGTLRAPLHCVNHRSDHADRNIDIVLARVGNHYAGFLASNRNLWECETNLPSFPIRS